MTEREVRRLGEIVTAIQAIGAHLERGDLVDPIVYDAVRMRLVEIGEAVKGLTEETRAAHPEIPWGSIARMRDVLTHRYFATNPQVVEGTVRDHLAELLTAAEDMLEEARPES